MTMSLEDAVVENVADEILNMPAEEMQSVFTVFGGRAAFQRWQCTVLADELERRLDAQARSNAHKQAQDLFKTLFPPNLTPPSDN